VLDVGAAFHSPLVAGVSGPFLEGLQTEEFSDSAIPVFANTTGDVYPSDPSEAKKLLAGQLAQPVEFVREIEAMYTAGVRAFVEVGPGARMSGLVRAILGDKEHAVYALDASNGKRDGVLDLARLLAALTASGHPLSLSEWDADYRPAKANDGKKRFTVPICGANYVAPKKTKAAVPKAKPAVAPANPAAVETRGVAVKKPAPAPTHVQAPVQAHAPTQVQTPTQIQAPAQVQAPAPAAAVPSMERSTAAGLLAQTQANIAALQHMQEQTAALHKQYLEGQENAASAIRGLLQQQHGLFQPGVVPAPQPVAAERPPAPIETRVEPTPEPAQPVAEEVAPPAPASVSPPAPASDKESDELRVGLLEVVAEKTGYPAEMLEPGMSLDGDLGIDSIKRVEILSALQERFPELPTIEAEELGAIQTLADILEHLGGAAEPVADAGASSPAEENYQGLLLGIVAEKTGYPVDMLEIGMSLDGDLGIDSIKRVEILSALQEEAPELPTIEAEDLGRLQTLEDILNHLDAVAPVAAATTLATDSFDVSPLLLEIVAEKTGYPVDMLELGMSLDADLGIDSIKRVEILSALQERVPDLPTVEAEDLGNMVTLQDVVSYLGEAQPDASLAVTALPSPPKTSAVESTLLAIVSEKTGYPSDMLELDMGLEGDLGIDSIKRVEILSALQERMPELSAIEAEDLGKLHTLRDVIAFISDGGESATVPAVVPSNGAQVSSDAGESASCAIRRSVPTSIPLDDAHRETIAIRPNATIWVTDDGSEYSAAIVARFEELEYAAQLVPIDEVPSATPDTLDGLVIVAPEAPIGEGYLKHAFALAQIAAPMFRQADGDRRSVFATISRLDGAFGLIGLEDGRSPLSGGLAGLSKTASHEWPEVACKALDVASDFKSVAKAASAAVDELLLSTPLEVGLSRTSRVTLSLEEQMLESASGAPRLAASDVIVVTGGARGVTAEVAVAMAKRYRCGLALLGRTELAGAEEGYLNGLESEAAIKKAVLDHADQKLAPKDLERICRGVLARREIEATLKRIEVAGGRGLYIATDIRKTEAVSSAIGQASKKLGTVTALVHGAGVLADRRIEDKTAEQFDLVYDTKVAGMNALLSVLKDSPLKAIVLFSSSTARFGRTGQSDYAMANEVLNKTALAEAAQRSDCRVLSMNWGPWDGGMVTPALKKIFEDEGVGVIGLEDGAELVLNELDAPEQGAVEIVILADPPGGASPPMTVSSSRALEPVVELSLETEAFPFLTSHVIDNKPVLPVAMYVEWFAHAALHGNPGMRFRGITDLRVLKGVVLDGNGPVAIRVCVGEAVRVEGGVTVPLEFRSVDAKGRDTLNAQANAILVSRLEKGEAALGPIDRNGGLPEAAALYNGHPLFHGAAFQGIREIEGCSEQGIAALVSPAPRPVEWIREPLRKSWIADPLVLDAAFQLMIVWSDATRGACSLPVAFRAYTQYQSTFPKGPVRIVANVIESGPHKAVADIEFYNASNDQLIAAIDGYECVIDASLNEAFKRNRCEPSPSGR
jgi:acyl carrier protein/NAD(P)-dependent dehydrogenase (short-subunit alcohol dehydrogenase family)